MNFIQRIKMLPSGTRRLLSVGIVFALVVALPLFVWGILYGNFNLNKKAASGEPTTTTPINWTTGQISIIADDFYVISNGKRYDGNSNIAVNPSASTPTTQGIEILSSVGADNIRLRLNFKKDTNNYSWWVEQITFANSDYSPNTSTFNGTFFKSVLSHSFQDTGNIVMIIRDPNSGQQIAELHYTNLQIQGFVGETPPPTACQPYPLTIAIDGAGTTGINQPFRYFVRVTHNDPNCLGGVNINLSARLPDGWTASFEKPSFLLNSNETYYTTIDITPSTYNTLNEPIIIYANTIYPLNSASKTVQLSVQPTNVPVSTPGPNECTKTCTSNYQCISSSNCVNGYCTNTQCGSTPNPLPTPTPTPTPYEKLSQMFTIRMKFTGVTDGSADGANVNIRFQNPTIGFDYFTSPIQVRHVGNGIYEATITFGSVPAALPTNGGYVISLKGEKHLATRFCQATGQIFRCSGNWTIPIPAPALNPASMVLDFTGLPLEPGDLYRQDGVANSDDFAKIKNLLNKSCSSLTPTEILTGDLDYNGCVNVRDAFLMRQTLQSRYDEN